MSSDHPNPVFQWRAHPANDRRASALAALAVILGLSAASYLSFGLPWAAASLVVLVLALNRFFLPSQFVIDAEGITARYPLRRQRIRWANLRRFVHDKHGGYLSTRSRRSRFDAYSGMHVLFGPHPQRDTIIQEIESHVSDTATQGGAPCPS